MSASIYQNLKTLLPKGKKAKRFLEKNDALSLAASIAEDIEKISTARSEKQHKIQPKTERKPSSSSKDKLKEAKAALRAKHLETKKEKSKSRKIRFKESHSSESSASYTAPTVSDKPPRKRVSFA